MNLSVYLFSRKTGSYLYGGPNSHLFKGAGHHNSFCKWNIISMGDNMVVLQCAANDHFLNATGPNLTRKWLSSDEDNNFYLRWRIVEKGSNEVVLQSVQTNAYLNAGPNVTPRHIREFIRGEEDSNPFLRWNIELINIQYLF